MSLTKKQRLNGLSFAAKLAELAKNAPDSSAKREAYRAVNRLRKLYGYTATEKKLEVLRLITLGASTAKDLEVETSFDRNKIGVAVAELLEENKIYSHKIFVTGSGRPTACYFPVDFEI